MSDLPHGVDTSPVVERRPVTLFAPPPTRPGRELAGHAGRSAATVHGIASVLIGVVPLLAGLSLLGVTGGVIGEEIATLRTPRWVAGIVALVFVLTGSYFVLHGWRGVSRGRRIRRLRANHPDEPWLWDHSWNAFASFDGTRGELRRGIPVVAMFAAFLLPFNWIAFAGDEPYWVFSVITGVFDAMLVLSIARLIYLALRIRRYGTTELRLPCFPCRTGDDIELKLVRTARLATLGELRGTLRCIQERYEVRGTGRGRGHRIVAYALHESVAEGEVTPGGEAIVFRFPVPLDAAGSSLTERPPRYWELSVEGQTPGVQYETSFLVPIYARPA